MNRIPRTTKTIRNSFAAPVAPAPAGRVRAGRNLAVALTAGAAAAALTTVLVRRRVGRLRFSRGLAAVQLWCCAAACGTPATRPGCSPPPGSTASSCATTWPCRPPRTWP